MQKSKLRNIALVLLGMFFLAACTSKTIQAPAVPAPPATPVSFKTDVLPIFTSCAISGCHVSGSVSPDLTPANAYNSLVPAFVNTTTPANSTIYLEVKPGGGMNGFFPSDKDPNTILYWIQQGAKNN